MSLKRIYIWITTGVFIIYTIIIVIVLGILISNNYYKIIDTLIMPEPTTKRIGKIEIVDIAINST